MKIRVFITLTPRLLPSVDACARVAAQRLSNLQKVRTGAYKQQQQNQQQQCQQHQEQEQQQPSVDACSRVAAPRLSNLQV